VEVTVYVHPDDHGRGIGRALYTSLFECLRLQGYCSAVAVIALPNPASVALHERLGFELVGVYRSMGYKHARWHDVGWWQLALRSHDPSTEPPRPLRDVMDTPEWENALRTGVGLLRV
jgi:phosphinothricin acetyltransferase